MRPIPSAQDKPNMNNSCAELPAPSPSLSVGFVLMPSFTLLPFSAFIDAL